MTLSGVLSVTQYVSPPCVRRRTDAALVAIVDHPIFGHPKVGTKNNRKERDKFAASLTFRFPFLLSQGQVRFEKNRNFFENFTSQFP